MHVLFLTHDFGSHAENPGGVAAVTRLLAERLNARPGVRVTVLTCETGLAAEEQETVSGVRCIHVPSPRPKIASRVVRDIPLVARRVRGISPDLVHSHLGYHTYAALRTGIPTVWTVHGITLNQKQDWKGLSGWVRGVIYDYLDRASLERVRDIIQISPYVRDVFSPYTRARFHPVENPVDPRFFRIRGEGTAGRILAVGSIERRKGTLVLLEAARILRDENLSFTLHIVGGAKEDSSYHREALRFVEVHGLGSCVSFRGIRTGEELDREYEEARICTLASREETAPVTILEAMASARPVVATSVSGNPWLVSEGETGCLVPHCDPRALADGLRALLLHPERGRRMGRAARDQAEKRFHPDFVVDETLRVYEKILGRGAG